MWEQMVQIEVDSDFDLQRGTSDSPARVGLIK